MEIDLGGDRQWLGNDIDVDREEDVDLSCDECRYNCSPPFDIIFGYMVGRYGLRYYCTFFALYLEV